MSISFRFIAIGYFQRQVLFIVSWQPRRRAILFACVHFVYENYLAPVSSNEFKCPSFVNHFKKFI